MNVVMREFVAAAKASPRLYLAPLVGVFSAVRNEIQQDNEGGCIASPAIHVAIKKAGKIVRMTRSSFHEGEGA